MSDMCVEEYGQPCVVAPRKARSGRFHSAGWAVPLKKKKKRGFLIRMCVSLINIRIEW